jgi:hypothetical protein
MPQRLSNAFHSSPDVLDHETVAGRQRPGALERLVGRATDQKVGGTSPSERADLHRL